MFPMVEAHIEREAVQQVVEVLTKLGSRALVHPHSGNGLEDHTKFAVWIGSPLPLDMTVFMPKKPRHLL